MDSITFKVKLNSYEDLVQFERKCFREGKGGGTVQRGTKT